MVEVRSVCVRAPRNEQLVSLRPCEEALFEKERSVSGNDNGEPL